MSRVFFEGKCCPRLRQTKARLAQRAVWHFPSLYWLIIFRCCLGREENKKHGTDQTWYVVTFYLAGTKLPPLLTSEKWRTAEGIFLEWKLLASIGQYWSPESQIQYSIRCFLSKLKVHWGSNASPWQSRVSMDLSRWENKCNLIKGRGGHQSWNEVYFLMRTWSQRRGSLSGASCALHPAWRRMSLMIRCEWPWVELQSYRSDMRFRKN